MSKRIMAMLLALVMVVGVLPVAALAEEPVSTTEPTTVPTETTAPTEAVQAPVANSTGDKGIALQSQQNGNGISPRASSYVTLYLRFSSPDAPFYDRNTGLHTEESVTVQMEVKRSTFGKDDVSGTVTAYFKPYKTNGWMLYYKVKIGNHEYPEMLSYWCLIFNKDMSKATGSATFNISFNSAEDPQTTVPISGAQDLPSTTYTVTYTDGVNGAAFPDQSYSGLASGATTPEFNGTPTREGFVWGGWNPAVTSTVTKNATYTAVWEEAVPSKPEWSDIRREMQKVSVHVTCINPDVNHTDKTYPYQESTDDVIGYVQDSAGSYTCTVTVHLGRYRLKYNQDFPREHEFVSSLTADVVLQYNGTGWVIASALPLELKLTCGSMPTPDPPGQDVLNGLKVLVECDAKPYLHTKTYKLGDGDYELKKVDDNTYTVTVTADKYVEKYNAVYPGHTLFDNNTKTIKLVYRYGAWTVVGSNGVTFNVSCEQKYTVTYTDGVDGEVIFADQVSYKKPGEKTPAFRGTPTRTGYVFTGWDPEVAETVTENATYTAVWEAAQPALPDAIFGSFTMKCVTQNANHYCREGVDIELAPLNAYTNSGVKTDDSGDTPVYYFELTVDAEKYLSQYDRKAAVSGKEPVEHTICAGQEPTVIRFNWNGSSWVQGNKPVVNAECKTEPEKPSGDIVKRLIDVQVVCGNIDHSVTTSSLNDDTFDTGNVTKEGDKYTCVITVHAGSYVNEYNATNPGHVLTPGSRADLTVRLVHNGSDWTLEDSRTDMMHVVFNVSDTYTVTYTDGVENEEIFADQVYGNLLSGIATPAFNGTPTRTGYVFGGWNPAFAAKVTESKIYSATWKPDANGNGIADDEEDKFTVTYTDGMDGKIFVNQVYENLLPGTATPAFNGTPTRTGYVFGGWNPAVAATVTGNATYTAVWEEDANGNGTPDKDEEKYTVSYTDGVENEEIFADQVYGNLLSGTATPTFNGTPTRTGYVFGGWNPTVADKVTESKIYSATWKPDANGNGIADDEEDKYTVTYTDGVKGKAFADQVYDNLLSGTDTPAFNGKPTRKGYTFVSWTPKVTDTVTKTVTYTATWKANSGKDNVPKTGDSGIVPVLGSVLLFSFCGAAVCVFDRKRKHI